MKTKIELREGFQLFRLYVESLKPMIKMIDDLREIINEEINNNNNDSNNNHSNNNSNNSNT